MAVKAERTAQPHVIRMRPYVRELLPQPELGPSKERMVELFGDPLKNRHGAFDFSKLPKPRSTEVMKRGQPYGWNFCRLPRGLVGTNFARFISHGVMRDAYRAAGISNLSEKAPPERKMVGAMSVLVKTSKMGCFSWNLPAGPPNHSGTCPGAQLAFYLDPEGEDKTDRIVAAIARSKSHVAEQLRSEVPDAREAVDRFICNGCYAMKNCYGNPSMILQMEWRRLWLEGWAMPRGLFIPTMVGVILDSRKQSQLELDRAGNDPFALALCTHPDYFRIHDSGDMKDEEYFDAWLEICERLPNVQFWAPTRIWAHEFMARVLEDRISRGKIPKNLALRPSSLFFDGPSPIVRGVSAGSSSNVVTFSQKRDKIVVAIKGSDQNSWVCPAYLPTVVGGGALPAITSIFTLWQSLSPQGQARYVRYLRKVVPNVKMGDDPEENVKKLNRSIVARSRKDPSILERALEKGREMQNGRRSNPVQQAFAMYPKFDAATPMPARYVFYDALYDERKERFLLDPHTARPLPASDENRKHHPNAVVRKVQAYQASGACMTARDPNHDGQCRVCWDSTKGKLDGEMRRLPVVYSKH